jgi:hypothetical protein
MMDGAENTCFSQLLFQSTIRSHFTNIFSIQNSFCSTSEAAHGGRKKKGTPPMK